MLRAVCFVVSPIRVVYFYWYWQYKHKYLYLCIQKVFGVPCRSYSRCYCTVRTGTVAPQETITSLRVTETILYLQYNCVLPYRTGIVLSWTKPVQLDSTSSSLPCYTSTGTAYEYSTCSMYSYTSTGTVPVPVLVL